MTRHTRKPLTDDQIAARDARRARFSDIAKAIGAMTRKRRTRHPRHLHRAHDRRRPAAVRSQCVPDCRAMPNGYAVGWIQSMDQSRPLRP